LTKTKIKARNKKYYHIEQYKSFHFDNVDS